MAHTIIEKIISSHSDKQVKPGDIVDVFIDARVARDFGGANVVKNLQQHNLTPADPDRTFFTFDCNPGGSDQNYAANQHACRLFARQHNLNVYDINQGIGTHLAIDENLIEPGGVFVSTDSHANIMGAIAAFGQGMGDVDIAAAFANGKVWFKVPKSLKIILKGRPGPNASAKDVVLAMLQKLGANGLLGYAAEVAGDYPDNLNLAGRITIASMATEMGGTIILFAPSEKILAELKTLDIDSESLRPDPDAQYDQTIEIDIDGLEPLAARPGHPEDVVEVDQLRGEKIDSAFIGSCTNGRIEDLEAAAKILRAHKVAPGVVLKIVPSTRNIWQQCLEAGLIETFMRAGALVGNAGCAGCAAGQIGQNGPGEVTISSGNRNFKGKQGKGLVYLASPATVAASAVAGFITTANQIPDQPAVFKAQDYPAQVTAAKETAPSEPTAKPTKFKGRAWFIPIDNIDTDMIYHNRYLSITDINQMGQYTFDNLEGFTDFAQKAQPGDIVVTGKNFGCGSSRQQAVDCFKNLGVSCILAQSFGAIYERNAINAAFPILTYSPQPNPINNGDQIEIDLNAGTIKNLTTNQQITAQPFSPAQMNIYQKGGLL